MGEFRKLTKQDLSGVHRDLRALIVEAQSRGAIGRRTTKGHIMLKCPETGKCVTMAGTPSDYRSLKNSRAWVEKMFMP